MTGMVKPVLWLLFSSFLLPLVNGAPGVTSGQYSPGADPAKIPDMWAAAGEASASLGDREWTASARSQEMFIADHPLAWIEELERDAAANGKVGFYAALIGLVEVSFSGTGNC